MSADWIAAFLSFGSLAVIALLIVHHLTEQALDANEPVPYLPVGRAAEWDRHVTEALGVTRGVSLRALEGGKR